MAVYVDLYGVAPRGARSGRLRHHLTADDYVEMHEFAERIGVNRCWHHSTRGRHPHYDVDDEQRERALAAGAHAVSPQVVALKSRNQALARRTRMGITTSHVPRLGVITYRHPLIEPQFSSPMHAVENLALGENEIGRRVCHRLKPVGVIHIPDEFAADREVAMALIRESGGVAVQYREDAPGLIAVAIDGVIGETLDLDALWADYRAWCRSISNEAERDEVLDSISSELDRLAPMRFADFADFGKVVPKVRMTRDGHEPGGWVRCGLLFGYPPATTVAYVLDEAGVEGAGSDLEDMKDLG